VDLDGSCDGLSDEQLGNFHFKISPTRGVEEAQRADHLDKGVPTSNVPAREPERISRDVSERFCLGSGIARCVPATWFGRHLFLAARALIVRAVLQSVWRLDLDPRLFVVERLS